MSRERVSVGEEGEGHSMLRDRNLKAQEPTVESLVRGIWRLRVSEAERTGGHVKWKTVTEIRRSSVRDIFIAESVYLVLNSLPDWKRVEKFKQVLCGQFLLCVFFSMRRAAQFCIRRRLWTEEAGRPERRELQ